MNIAYNGRPEQGQVQMRWARTVAAIASEAGLTLALLAGCASPGPPLPPSLKLPAVVTDLTASRVGDQVELRWTTPSRTTDKMPITGPILAEICRATPAGTAASAASSGRGTVPGAAASAAQGAARDAARGAAQGAAMNAQTVPCSPILLRMTVTPGASYAVDKLPAALTVGPARLLGYRVQLRNAAGRTAGASAVAWTTSGAAPQVVENMRGRATRAGIVLEWTPEARGFGAASQAGAEAVELERTALQPATKKTMPTVSATSASKAPANAGRAHKIWMPGTSRQPQEMRLRVDESASGTADAGGTIDRTAQTGTTYRYTAQRVWRMVVDGQEQEARSKPSAGITVAMPDDFPPEAPVGLVAVPGFVSEPPPGQQPAIDLSWEPDMGPGIAGYRVYRRGLDSGATNAWRRLNQELVPVAVYRDPTVTAGERYAYRVTAVDVAGQESRPSREVVETAPAVR